MEQAIALGQESEYAASLKSVSGFQLGAAQAEIEKHTNMLLKQNSSLRVSVADLSLADQRERLISHCCSIITEEDIVLAQADLASLCLDLHAAKKHMQDCSSK